MATTEATPLLRGQDGPRKDSDNDLGKTIDALEVLDISSGSANVQDVLSRCGPSSLSALVILAASTKDMQWRSTYRTMIRHAVESIMVESESDITALQGSLQKVHIWKGRHYSALDMMLKYEALPLYDNHYIQSAIRHANGEESKVPGVVAFARSAVCQRYLVTLAVLVQIILQALVLHGIFDASISPVRLILLIWSLSLFLQCSSQMFRYRSSISLASLMRILASTMLLVAGGFFLASTQELSLQRRAILFNIAYTMNALASFPLYLDFLFAFSTHFKPLHQRTIFIERIISKSAWTIPFALIVGASSFHSFMTLHRFAQQRQYSLDLVLKAIVGAQDYEAAYLYRPISGRIALITSSILVSITTGLIFASYLDAMSSDVWTEVENIRIYRLAIDINDLGSVLPPPFNFIVWPKVLVRYIHLGVVVPVNIVLFGLPLGIIRLAQQLVGRFYNPQFHRM